MLPDIRSVPLPSIDRENFIFRVSTHVAPDTLVTSMKCPGLIHPPILIPRKNRFVIVSGFARISTAERLAWDAISAHILPEDTPHVDCALLAIADNASLRTLNPVEQARGLALLSPIAEDQDQLVALACSAGLPVNHDMAQKLTMVSQMDPLLQEGLIRDAIALPVALQLCEMREADVVQSIATLLLELNLSLNRQREVVEWLVAISANEGIGIHEILNEGPVAELRQDSRIDPRQKSTTIRRHLRRRRYPTITQAEERYHRNLREIKLPQGVQLDPPPHFEGEIFSLRIGFKTVGEIKRAYKDVERLIHSSEFRKLLEGE